MRPKKHVVFILSIFILSVLILLVWNLPRAPYQDSTFQVDAASLSTKRVELKKKAIPQWKTSTNSLSETNGYDVPILMYHAIDDYSGDGIKELYVTPANFESQMIYLKSAGFTPITFDDLDHIGQINKPILITFDDGYKNNLNAYHILKEISDDSFPAKAVIFMIGYLIDSKPGLSTEDLKEMSDSGIISVQSHTETHPMLTTTMDYKKELGDIKAKLERITGKKVTAIAYPTGDYNATVIEHTKKYYDYAVTTVPGIANTGSSHYELKRLRVNYSTSLEAFKKLVNQ